MSEREDVLTETVLVYAAGLVALSACCPAGMPIDDVTDEVNRQYPTGLRWGWGPSLDPTFATGEPNPCPCELDGSRLHRLFNC